MSKKEEEMKEYDIPVTWEMCGLVKQKATSLEEAIKFFGKNLDNIKIPNNGEYVELSFRLTFEESDLEEINLYQEK